MKPKVHKLTVEIDAELYAKVKNRFYHGQLTALLRSIFQSLEDKMTAGEVSEIASYISNSGELLLKPHKEKK